MGNGNNKRRKSRHSAKNEKIGVRECEQQIAQAF